MKPISMIIEKIKEIELKNCPVCKAKLKKIIVEKKDVALAGYKCEKCNEVYFPSSEIVRYEILTGKRKPVRTIGRVGNSIIIRIPSKLANEFGIKEGYVAYFEKRNHDVSVKILPR